jgi:hypothetical protein
MIVFFHKFMNIPLNSTVAEDGSKSLMKASATTRTWIFFL